MRWVKTLPRDVATEIATRQLLRSATSVGANVEEADGASTSRDRVRQWVISRKEARYWLRLLCAAGADSPEARALEQEKGELIKILSTLIRKNSTG